jgi:hypothetical protein
MSCSYRISTLTCEIERERATESGRRESNPRPQLGKPIEMVTATCTNCGKVQVNAFRISTLVFVIAPCSSSRVARNGSDAACCTLLHDGGRGPQPCELIT